MHTETYKGRTITILDYGHPELPTKAYKRVEVNGAAQFSFRAPDDFILAETCRYIDAVDADAERARQKAAAGGYTETSRTDFADSWRAA